MKLAKMLLAAAKVAVLLSGYDDLGATRCRWPGRKATVLRACALAERLQPVASITNRCPSTSDLRRDDVDAWNQPFLISCEQGDQITVVASMGLMECSVPRMTSSDPRKPPWMPVRPSDGSGMPVTGAIRSALMAVTSDSDTDMDP